MSDPDTTLSGRARHLTAVKGVFDQSGEPWVYFAMFLKVLFGDITLSTVRRREVPQPIQCRHAMMDLPPANSPCVAMGTWDRNRNPGLVVHDICLSAMEFLRALGWEVAQDEKQQNRLSAKMRVSTLAYLWKFADDPDDLRREFDILKNLPPHIGVLHLCGCGLCVQVNGKGVLGCCQKDHLVLGSLENNRNHKVYHDTLKLIQPTDYTALVQIIQRSKDGQGIF
ncbi:hypothetical protein BJX96DRAFT_176030 [Aspergillus floccosus]